MTFMGRIMVFENVRDFLDTAHIHNQYPESAFGMYVKLDRGRFGFEILDTEVFVAIKLATFENNG